MTTEAVTSAAAVAAATAPADGEVERTPDGKYLENLDLIPDELVLNAPEDTAAGRDRQLDRAVDVLLEQLPK